MSWLVALIALTACSLSLPTASDANPNAVCWGRNENQQLGNLAYGTDTSSLPLAVDSGDLFFTKIAPAPAPFTCALSFAGHVYCWGQNDYECIAEGTIAEYVIDPTRRVNTETFIDMCTGPSTVCGILSNGSVACWGNNDQGALGSGLSYSVLSTSASPRLVPNIGSATAISCGALFNCALDSGKAYCWGTTTTGQLGNGTTGSVGSPVPVQVLTNATNIAAISTGVNHACLIDSDNRMQCWGNNGFGQLGINNNTLSLSALPLPVAGFYKQVSCGYATTCAIGTDDLVYCWGASAILAPTSPQKAPKLIAGLPSSIQHVSTGRDVACAQTSNGTVYCWGIALYGELGRGNVSSAFQSPAAIPSRTFAQGSVTVPNSGYSLPAGYSVCGLLDMPSPSPSPSPSRSPSPSPSAVPIPQAPFVKPVFDDVVPQVKLLPVDQEGVVGKPDDGALFSFVSVEEVSINGVVERSFSLAQALWAADSFVPVGGGDAITAVGYKSELSNNVTVRYSFFSYNRSLDVAVGDNFTLPMTPSFLKFSLVITTWPWLAPNNSLRVTLKVTPAFTSERTVVNYPKDDMTSLLLSSASSASSVLVRVINFGLAGADGRERVGVETSANVTSSSLVFAVDHFADDLAYDPDLSVLVGRRGEDGGGGGGTDLALIVAVSVAVPLAVLFVLVVIVASLLIIRHRQQRRQSLVGNNINYDDSGNGSDGL